MNKELVDYIKQQLSLSVSKNKITDVLLEQGWHQTEIDEAFLDAESGAIRDEGGALAQNFDDRGRENGSGGKKLLLVAGLSAAAMLVLAAIAVSFFGGANRGENQTNLPLEPANGSGAGVAVTENPRNEELEQPAAFENQIDPVLLAEIAKLEKTITPPAGWTSRQGTVSYRPLAIFFKPELEKDANGNDVFNENISIVRDNLIGAESEYVAKAKETLTSRMENYKIISERKVSLADGTAATLIGGSFAQNGMAMKNMQLYAAKGGNIYIITGVTLERNWNAQKDMIGAAVMSFKFPAN